MADISPDGELATYRDYIEASRQTLLRICDDLHPDQMAQRAIPPSNLSLLGLLRHLAAVEQNWVQRCLAERRDEPRLWGKDHHHDADLDQVEATHSAVTEAHQAFGNETRAADFVLDGLDDDDLSARRPVPRGGGEITVRDALVHLIAEYSRHLGHADLLREVLDGSTGL